MRIFVTGTGRCGTVTLWQALRHATNFDEVGHESRTFGEGATRVLWYEDNTIEVSSHLAIHMAELRTRYPDSVWIKLWRDPQQCIKSLVANCSEEMLAYAKQWYQVENESVQFCAATYYRDINLLIDANEPDYLIEIDDARQTFSCMWSQLGIEGDIELAMLELERHYNTTNSRGKDEWE